MLPVKPCPFERSSGLVDIDQQLIHRPANPLLPDDLRNSPVLLLPALPLSLAGVLAFHYAVLHLRRPGAISDGLREDAMAQHEAWQVGGSAAELYQRYLVPAIASLWAADLIDRAAPRPGERVLDVACGTGVVSRLAAERTGSGRVVGLDINAGMLAVARSLNSPSIEWYEGSALAMPFPDSSFDLCLCQFGLQFFPDRPAAMREMFRVLQLGSRVALSVFSAIERTPVTNALADALDRRLRPGASSIKRSEHSLANADDLRQLAVGQGFRDVSVNTITQTLRFVSPREYVRMQLTATPLAGLVADMESGPLDVLMDAIAGDLNAALCRDGEEGLVSPQEAHVLLARK